MAFTAYPDKTNIPYKILNTTVLGKNLGMIHVTIKSNILRAKGVPEPFRK